MTQSEEIEHKGLTIKKDKEGNLRRVWVQQKVKDLEFLVKLQEDIASVNTDFKPEYVPGLHMTLAHFGIPKELYEDFKKVLTSLTFDQFMEHFYKLLKECDEAVKEEIKVDAEKIDLLGRFPHHVAVIKIIKTPELTEMRSVVSKALHQFVKGLGVNDVNQFLLESPNLQFEPDEVYNPHITLGYVGENITLPQIDLSNLKITLRPSDIGGVEKVFN